MYAIINVAVLKSITFLTFWEYVKHVLISNKGDVEHNDIVIAILDTH